MIERFLVESMKSVSDFMSVFVKNVRILGAVCELISNVKVLFKRYH